mgnify:FL=1
MYIQRNSWEFIVEIKNNAYTLKKADPETRIKQLKEFKEKRKKELKKELNKLNFLI